MINIKSPALETRTLFRGIFSKKPKSSVRKTVSAQFHSFKFNNVRKLPLIQLIYNRWISELDAIEVLIKHEEMYVTKDDLAWLKLDLQGETNVLHIVITGGEVSEETTSELNQLFTSQNVLVVMIGDPDRSHLWTWLTNLNKVACIVFIFMLAFGVVNKPKDKYTLWSIINRKTKELIKKSLDEMGEFSGDQLRTMVKKIEFLLVYEEESANITKACKEIGVTRKTFYNWYNQDKAFKGIIGNHWDVGHHKSRSYQNSPWFKSKQNERILAELWKGVNEKEITHERS